MPTLLVKYGLRFFFFSDENKFKPPHIHVEKGGRTAIFWLEPVSMQKNRRMKPKELAEASKIIVEYRKEFLRKYNEFHGKNGRS